MCSRLAPDRTAATLSSWLKEHPGVVVTARDRSLEYAPGIREGAPESIQVADHSPSPKLTNRVAATAIPSIIQNSVTAW